MKEDAEGVIVTLKENFGNEVDVRFVDVSTEAIKEYPSIEKVLPKVRLPLTVINNEPRFHGGLSIDVISDALQQIKKEQGN